MKKITTLIRWATFALVLCVVSFAGRGSAAAGAAPDRNLTKNNPPSEKIERVVFSSSRALDGSNATSANYVFNIWVMNADGSSAKPLTKLTAEGADSYAPVGSPDGTKIAFYSSRSLDGSDAANGTYRAYNIWVMNADGSNAKPLTKLTVTTDTFTPGWSPDGTKIAFVSKRPLDGSDTQTDSPKQNIWIVNADGSDARPLTKLTADGAENYAPAWSPDGTKIAFYSSRSLDGSDSSKGPCTNIWVINADGSNAKPLTKLTNQIAGSSDAVWSPDGTKIAFTSIRSLNGRDSGNDNYAPNVWVMKADGSKAEPLTKVSGQRVRSQNPAWSPDGKRIAFYSNQTLNGYDLLNGEGTFNIWVMNANGSKATPVTRTVSADIYAYDAVWSPDGTRIAFYSNQALDGSDAAISDSIQNVWVVKADGTGAAPVTKLKAAKTKEPHWLP